MNDIRVSDGKKRWKRILIVGGLCSLLLTAGSFEKNCIPCHRKERVSLRRTFMNALLIYSGEKNMKAGLKYFLRHPSIETSVMGKAYFRIHGLKAPSRLSERELDEALDQYWERYKVVGRLK